MAATQGPRQQWHDTEVLPGSLGWQDTAVLVPMRPAVAPGWYADPYDAAGMRFWDGHNWTGRTQDPARFSRPRSPGKRRSVLLAFVLAFFFGGLALPYALPLPGWVRLLLAAGIAFVLGWWMLLVIPLSWPFALIAVPAFTALFNPRS